MTTGQNIIDFIKNNNLENEFVEMCIPQDSRTCLITFSKPINEGVRIFYIRISSKRDYNLGGF